MAKDKKISQVSVADKVIGDELLPFAKNDENGAITTQTILNKAKEEAKELFLAKDSTIEADKLKTPVRIWGQEFDGSKDVEGSLDMQGDSINDIEALFFQGGEEKIRLSGEDVESIKSKLEGITKAADDSKVIKSILVNGAEDTVIPHNGGLVIDGYEGINVVKGSSVNNNNIEISADTEYLATKEDLKSFIKGLKPSWDSADGPTAIPVDGYVVVKGHTGILTDSEDGAIYLYADTDYLATKTSVDAINEKIPAQASADNQLADKNFVNSSIATNTAEFKGTYNSLSELQSVTADANDYGFVVSKDVDGNTVYNRYKYVEGEGWQFEYTLNNSSFTAAQWATIQSGLTTADANKLRNEVATKNELDVVETLAESINKGLGETIQRVDELETSPEQEYLKEIYDNKDKTPTPESNQIIYTTTDNRPLGLTTNDDWRIESDVYYRELGFGVLTMTVSQTTKTLTNNTRLKTAILGENIIGLQIDTFKGCTSLESIEILGRPTEIANGFLKGCKKLRNIDIPDSVTSIGTEAFEGCASLTSLDIPDSVITFATQAFANCTSLTSLKCSENATSLPDVRGCTSLSSVTLPKKATTTLVNYNFNNCQSLQKIDIPDSVKMIYRLNSNLFALRELKIPADCTLYTESFTNLNLDYLQFKGEVTIDSVWAFGTNTTVRVIDSAASNLTNFPPNLSRLESLILRYNGVIKDVETYVTTYIDYESENTKAYIANLEQGIMPLTNLDTYIGTPNNWLKIYVPANRLAAYRETYPTLVNYLHPITGEDDLYATTEALQADKTNLANFKQHVEADFVKDVDYNNDKATIMGEIMKKASKPTIVTASGTTLIAEDNTYYRFDAVVNSLTVTLPASNGNGLKNVVANFTTGNAPAITINSADSKEVSFFSGFSVEPNLSYELNMLFNGVKWVVGYGVIN